MFVRLSRIPQNRRAVMKFKWMPFGCKWTPCGCITGREDPLTEEGDSVVGEGEEVVEPGGPHPGFTTPWRGEWSVATSTFEVAADVTEGAARRLLGAEAYNNNSSLKDRTNAANVGVGILFSAKHLSIAPQIQADLRQETLWV